MKLFRKLLLVIGFTLGTAGFIGPASAQEAPDALIKRVAQDVLDTAKSDKEIQGGNRQRIYQVVEAKILPHLDFQRATALAAGRHWRDATPEQRKRLSEEFRNLLLYTYAGAMAQVKDERFEFRPFRADPADTEVEVHTRLVRPQRGEPVQVSYRLAKSADGWKIYDVNVLGVWMAETYRSSFTSEINKGGIDGLIGALTEKNRKLAAGVAPKAAQGQG